MTLGYREARLLRRLRARAGRRVFCAATSSTMRALIATGDDAPLVDLAEAGKDALGTPAADAGNVTGTFFHAIARSV